MYAYKLKRTDEKVYNRFLEEYLLYICSNELGAVSIHNLTVTEDMIEETILEGQDEAVGISQKEGGGREQDKSGEKIGDGQLEIYKGAETLLSGSGTVTGFSLDLSKNPTVTYQVKRNGTDIATPYISEFTEDGRYEITLKSDVGDTETIEIYVDRSNEEDALANYFGSGFITGKRIYAEGNYPVYEAGETKYHVDPVDDIYLPISGTIINQYTGKQIDIPATRDGIDGTILDAGEYVAEFTTAPVKDGVPMPGDWRTFTFRFSMIEQGTAPGPVVNEKSLRNYAASTMVDVYPQFYGVADVSAGRGNITYAFATMEAAVQYAREVAKSKVEDQGEGIYMVPSSSAAVQKEEVVSASDMTDAVYAWAEQDVQKKYFDMSNPSTYRTLHDDVISETDNLRTTVLEKSVTIFGEGQKAELCELGISLPIINNKPYIYISPGTGGEDDEDCVRFVFIKDQYGIDSDSVEIVDCNGNVYPIMYEMEVEEQLKKQNCPTGVITIKEKTCYGDENEYEAVYFSPGDNTAKVSLTMQMNEGESIEEFSQSDDGTAVKAEAFSVKSVVDSLDPYTLVSVSCNGKTDKQFVADQIPEYIWSNPGEYGISVINRLGNKYCIKVIIEESKYATIAFTGSGTEELKPILEPIATGIVKLPFVTREGYDFQGYEDEKGNLYVEELILTEQEGEITLQPIWKAKESTLILQDAFGNIVDTRPVEYGREYTIENGAAGAEGQTVMWMKDGEVLPDNRIRIESEGDVVLVAVVQNEKNDVDIEDETEGADTRWGVVVALLVMMLTPIAYVTRKRIMQ